MKIVTYPHVENTENHDFIRISMERALKGVCDMLQFDVGLLDTVAVADPEHMGQAVKEVAGSESGGFTNKNGTIMGGKTSSFRVNDGSLRFNLIFNSAILGSLPEIEQTEKGWKLTAQNWSVAQQSYFYALPHEIGHCIDALKHNREYDGKAIWTTVFKAKKHLDWAAGSLIEEFSASYYSAILVTSEFYQYFNEFSGVLLLRQLRSLRDLTRKYNGRDSSDLLPIALGAVDLGFRFLYLNSITLGMRLGNEALKELPIFYWTSAKELLNHFDETVLKAAQTRNDEEVLETKNRIASLIAKLVYTLGFKFEQTYSDDFGDGIYWDAPTLNAAILEIEGTFSKFRSKHGQLVE